MPSYENLGPKIKQLRNEKGLSTRQLADLMYVSQPTITRWETGERVPDLPMISALAKALEVGVGDLINITPERKPLPSSITVVDDEKIVLNGELAIFKKIFPKAQIRGFSRASEALAYIKTEFVQLVFLDIEMGKTNGLDLCRRILELSPETDVVFLTAYRDYSLDAWSTGACGFMVKPLSVDDVARQLELMRYPVPSLEAAP